MVDNTIATVYGRQYNRHRRQSFLWERRRKPRRKSANIVLHSSKGKGMHKFSTAVVSLQKVNGICSLTGPSMATECELNLKLVLSLG